VTDAHRFQPLSTPPADFGRAALQLVEMSVDGTLFRIHRLRDAPLSFGREARNRFDDPRGSFGVCYFGLTPEAAFAESMLRRPHVRLLSRAFLDERGMSEFSQVRLLRLVLLHGAGLALVGATADIASGPHEVARSWSRACWEHPSQPDGIEYRCRHDDDHLAVALFDRAATALQAPFTRPLRQDSAWFGSILDRYGLGLDE
jgi:RES domain